LINHTALLAAFRAWAREPAQSLADHLIALSVADVNLRSHLPYIWTAARPEQFLQYRRDAAEAASSARKRRREKRRAESKVRLTVG
jgi:hypothetical protein